MIWLISPLFNNFEFFLRKTILKDVNMIDIKAKSSPVPQLNIEEKSFTEINKTPNKLNNK